MDRYELIKELERIEEKLKRIWEGFMEIKIANIENYQNLKLEKVESDDSKFDTNKMEFD
jgi:hypothetical protein